MRLTRSTTHQLCIRARQGSASARAQLLQSHLGLVIHAARGMYRSGSFLEMADLIQQGCLGLLHAIEKFDPFRTSRGRPVSFATYAHYWIGHYIRREIQNHGRTVALPVHRSKETGPQMVALDAGSWLEDSEGHAFAREVDLEAPADGWENAWDARRLVEGLLDKLPRQTQATIRCRFGLTGNNDVLTRQQTAKHLGISSSQAGQLERHGMALLQQFSKSYLG